MALKRKYVKGYFGARKLTACINAAIFLLSLVLIRPRGIHQAMLFYFGSFFLLSSMYHYFTASYFWFPEDSCKYYLYRYIWPIYMGMTGIGVWLRRGWARISVIFFSVLGIARYGWKLAKDVYDIFHTGWEDKVMINVSTNGILLVISVLFLFYISRKGVASFYSKTAPVVR